MVAVEELLLYFLIVPAIAYAVGALWVRRTMRAIAERQLGFLRETGANARFFVYLALFAVPIVFGIVTYTLAAGIQVTSVSDPVVRLLGVAWALASILTVLSEAWIVVRWKAASFKEMFARVLVLIVIPETVIVWTLTLAIMVVGVLRRSTAEPPISQSSADAVARALEYMIVGTLAAPLTAFLVNRQPVLSVRTFRRVLVWAVVGDILAVVCLVLAFRQIPRT